MRSCRRLRRAAGMGCCLLLHAATSGAQTSIRIAPPNGATLAVGQRFDLRIEATGSAGRSPDGLTITLDGEDISGRNMLDPGGTLARPVSPAPAGASTFLLQGFSFDRSGPHVVVARASDGTVASATVDVRSWDSSGAVAARARNVIFFLGDGMGASHRTAARIVSRGVTLGKANGRLAMDRLPATGQVMTPSLNSVITDSSPGMSSYSTGHKASNNQEGVYPDNTSDPFDNPRVEYVGELLRRVRGPGFRLGIVTTADVTDATPAANAVHTAQRGASFEIARRLFEERDSNAVTVLMGGGRANFLPAGAGGRRTDARNLSDDYQRQGYRYVTTATQLRALAEGPPPPAILGLFHQSHMSVAFDKVGAGRYSQEFSGAEAADLRDQPMLDDMTRAALRSLSAHAPDGFFLLVEGASIDKQAHAVDAERVVWDTIEFDNAVAVALAFAETTNGDADPSNDTLVIVTADHESGGLSIIGVGNERYVPGALGRAVRDYAAVFRFAPEQELNFWPNYERGDDGYPRDPDPSRKLLFGWAAAPDRYENWVSNRRALPPALDRHTDASGQVSNVAVANPARDGDGAQSDNVTVGGRPVPGFLVQGTIENGANACAASDRCPGDTSSVGHAIAGHTASDVPLSAYGPGMLQFTGTYENTDVFVKILRATTGGYDTPGALLPK